MSGLLTNGAWHGNIFSGGWNTSEGGVIKVTEPATGDVLGEVGLASAGDIDRAAAAAAAAQPSWAETLGPQRAAIIRKVAALAQQHRDELAGWIIRESGSSRGKAGFEISIAIENLWEAASLPTQPIGHILPASEPGRDSHALRVPVGVVGVITPWNLPFSLAMRAVAPALALGNAVVLKPDVQTAVCGGAALAALFQEAGLPDGVLHVLAGDAEPGQAVCENPDISMVSFTGSTSAGRQVGATAGRNLKRVALELGGNNALIVLDDADLDAASSAGAWGAFLHQGQICVTSGRHIVLEAVAEEYLDKLTARAKALAVGNPNEGDFWIGPLINEEQLDRVDRIVSETVSAGAELKTGGTYDRLFYQPTVLAGVTSEMPAFREEIFGPVAPVVVVANEDEAIVAANDSAYGLSAAVQTGSADRGRAVAERLRAGMVHINGQTVNDDAWAPFGGTGQSGNGGRFGAQSHWEEFTQWQWVTSRDHATEFPF